MTNQEYRETRGTDKPFEATPEQVRRIWRRLYQIEIAHTKAIHKRYGHENPFLFGKKKGQRKKHG